MRVRIWDRSLRVSPQRCRRNGAQTCAKQEHNREAPPDRECDEAVPGCILVQVTPGHRFEFALKGCWGQRTYCTDTFKHLQLLMMMI